MQRALLAIAVLLCVAAVVLLPEVRSLDRKLVAVLDQLEGQAALILILLYLGMASCMLPIFPLDLAAGAHFGFVQGVLWVHLSAMIASMTTMGLSRTLLRHRLEPYVRRVPRFRLLLAVISQGGWWMLLLLRMSPILPYGVANYLYGVARTPVLTYATATFCGMLPGTLFHVLAGSLARDLAGAPIEGLRIWVSSLGFLAAAALFVFGARLAQNVMKRELERAERAEGVAGPPQSG